MTLQTLAFFSYLHYYFMFQVVLCRARGHYLCEHDGKAHTKTKRKTTESRNFITQVRAVKHTICSCKDGAARRATEEANTGQVNKLTIKMLTEQTGMRLPKTHRPKTNPKNSTRCIGVCLSCRGPVQPDNSFKNMLPGAAMCAWLWEARHKLCQSTESSTSNIILETIRANKARQESCASEVSRCVEDGREKT